ATPDRKEVESRGRGEGARIAPKCEVRRILGVAHDDSFSGQPRGVNRRSAIRMSGDRIFHKRKFARLFRQPLINCTRSNRTHGHWLWKNVEYDKSNNNCHQPELSGRGRVKPLLHPIEKTSQPGGGEQAY